VSREDPDVIDSVEKAFRVLMTFSAEHPAMTVSETAELTGLTRATARRVLLTLARLGFAHAEDRRFRLNPSVLRLSYGYLSSQPWWEHAQRHMRALADRLDESCSMAVLDGPDIVYVARVPSSRAMSITPGTGSRLPAYPTSMGRVLLAALPPEQLDAYLREVELVALTERTLTEEARLRAELDAVRARGYAIIDGEREIGVRSAAAPVRTRSGAVLAALNISVNAARISVEDLTDRCLPALLETARAISVELPTS
jgi:IclR family transcriptional regulator, pca regulon regulatory protein